MSTVVTLWWLGFFTALGLCIGSFLNAVIYRLPRHGSLRVPRWSACPSCRHRIQWFDNLPILSFLHLRGRCRHCGVAIGTRYVVVEAGMAIIVLLLVDTFFIGHHRAGLSHSVIGLTEELLFDWPILLAHIVLFACLFAMSAIDLEHYWVDIRFTNLATAVGFVAHMLWTPLHSEAWIRPDARTAAACMLGLLGVLVVWLILVCQPHNDDPSGDGTTTESEFPIVEPIPPVQRPHWYERPSRAFAWAAVLLLAALWVVLFLVDGLLYRLPFTPRGLIPLAFFFLLIVRESTVIRGSDEQIAETIEEERGYARMMAFQEFLLFVPAVGLASFGLWLMSGESEWSSRISAALHTDLGFGRSTMFRNWRPLEGIATAATGFMIAGALGWAIRIVFTLVLGKEAFGTGDIHLMAAAGCVAGWPVAVIGFFLTCILALIGWVLVLPFKRTRALPLGPWLSISFLAVVLFYEPIVRTQFIRSLGAVAQLVFGTSEP